ncbi:MAG: DUF4831 family protein [Bacteroidaceae bacterium]|jgi:hypothetical protein
MKNILLFSALLCSCFLSAQTEVSVYGSDKAQTEGITYMLPKNRITVVVTAVKRTYTPGQYCRYAEEYLRLSNVQPEASTYWELQKVEAYCSAVPDPQKAFFIQLTGKSITSRAQLSPDGMLLAINDKQDYTPAPGPQPLEVKPQKKFSPEDYYTEDIIRAASAMATARLIADEIYQIRERRNDLTRGELENMPQDGASMQIVLNQLNEQETALTSVFCGTTQEDVKQFTFVVEPNAEVDEAVLFRFSRKLGVVDADNLAGEPVYYSLASQNTVPDKTPRTEEEQKRVDKMLKEAEKRAKKGESQLMEGVVYNVPERVDFSIYTAQNDLFSAEYKIAQMGNTDVLLNELFDKKSTFHVLFNPEDGSLLKVWQDQQE